MTLEKLPCADWDYQGLARELNSFLQGWQNKKVKQTCAPGPLALGPPVLWGLCWACKLKQNKEEEEKRGSEDCLVLHFSLLFSDESLTARECRENLKRLCLLRISTKPDGYQHLSPAHSLSGGFKARGDLFALLLGEASTRAGLQLQV